MVTELAEAWLLSAGRWLRDGRRLGGADPAHPLESDNRVRHTVVGMLLLTIAAWAMLAATAAFRSNLKAPWPLAVAGGFLIALVVFCIDLRTCRRAGALRNVSFCVECKRELSDASEDALREYAGQAAVYTDTDAALGILLVLDLTTPPTGAPDLFSSVWIEQVQREHETQPRHIVIA